MRCCMWQAAKNRELQDFAARNKDLKSSENPRAANPHVTKSRAVRTPCKWTLSFNIAKNSALVLFMYK